MRARGSQIPRSPEASGKYPVGDPSHRGSWFCFQERRLLARVLCLFLAGSWSAGSEAHAQTDEPLRIGQWISIDQVDLGLRARSQQRTDGSVEARGLEHLVALRGQFEFDGAGRQRIVFGAYSGASYASGWNPSGIGGQFSPAIYLKHLYLAVSLSPHLEVEYGSLYPIPGKSTATIGYDNDGYLAGQRVRLTYPTWFFDEITGTYAHFGSTDRQQFTDRLATLFQPNLVQVFLTKQISPRWNVAGDYTAGAGTHTIRLALSGENRMGFDSLRMEMYREMAKPRGFGLGVHARRSLSRRVILQGGYGDIDTRQALLSGTEFFDGRRVYAQAEIRVTRALSGRLLWTRAFANSRPVSAARRFEVGLLWDALALRR